jgi:hypothetical protein
VLRRLDQKPASISGVPGYRPDVERSWSEFIQALAPFRETCSDRPSDQRKVASALCAGNYVPRTIMIEIRGPVVAQRFYYPGNGLLVAASVTDLSDEICPYLWYGPTQPECVLPTSSNEIERYCIPGTIK